MAIVVVLVLAFVAVCGGVVVVGLGMAAPKPVAIGAPPVSLPSAEPVRFPSPSGSLLQGWVVPGVPGRPGVVLMHGAWGNRLGMVERARLLNEAGLSVLLFDFQAQGESPGKHITFGHLEALDAAAAVAFLRGRLGDGVPVGALGISLGAAAALLGPAPLPVDALVLELTYTEIGATLRRRVARMIGPVLGPPLAPVLAPIFLGLMKPMIGVWPGELRPIDHIDAVTAPLLVAAGEADPFISMPQSQALFERATAPKRFWSVPGAGHVDLLVAAPDDYPRTVIAFLRDTLMQKSQAAARPTVQGARP